MAEQRKRDEEERRERQRLAQEEVDALYIQRGQSDVIAALRKGKSLKLKRVLRAFLAIGKDIRVVNGMRLGGSWERRISSRDSKK